MEGKAEILWSASGTVRLPKGAERWVPLTLLFALQNERQRKGESYWYSVTASVVTRIVENIEVSPLTFIKCEHERD